jgi:hypothetical protein
VDLLWVLWACGYYYGEWWPESFWLLFNGRYGEMLGAGGRSGLFGITSVRI